MGNDSHRETLIIVNPAAHNVPSRKRLEEGGGWLNEAVNGLAGSETALAPIRAGTVNIWAKEMGFPRKPAQAVKAAVEGDRRRVRPGPAGGAPLPAPAAA